MATNNTNEIRRIVNNAVNAASDWNWDLTTVVADPFVLESGATNVQITLAGTSAACEVTFLADINGTYFNNQSGVVRLGDFVWDNFSAPTSGVISQAQTLSAAQVNELIDQANNSRSIQIGLDPQ